MLFVCLRPAFLTARVCVGSDDAQEVTAKKARTSPGTSATAGVGGSSHPGVIPGSPVGGGDAAKGATSPANPGKEVRGVGLGGETRAAPVPGDGSPGDAPAMNIPATGKNRAPPRGLVSSALATFC